MVDTYSKLLGLSDAPPPPSDSGKVNPAQTSLPEPKKAHFPVNQQTRKEVKKQIHQTTTVPSGKAKSTPVSPPPRPEKDFDTSLLTTKEKTKYGTYLTEESIENIRIHAIQTKRDDHQILQEAVNQYFERVKK